MDEQTRCDDFYRIVQSERWAATPGTGSEEVARWLGAPTTVETLVHEGHTWTQIVYDFEAVPSAASAEEREAFARGMRFAPSLLFRDRVCVPFDDYVREVLGGMRFAVIPEELRFRPGGTFP